MILDVKNKKILTIVSSLLIVFILSFIFIQTAFFKPTKINSFIASKIYKTPANKAFTDENFYKCVVDSYNREKKTEYAYTYNLSDDELASLNKLYCSWAENYDITDTTGLEKMVGLTYIDLNGTIEKLNKIDLSNNKNLVYLKLSGEKYFLNYNGNISGPFSTEINELDISNNVALKELYIEKSKLTTLDLSKNTALETLDVARNQLTELDVSKNTNLQYLSLGYNKLSSIDLTNNTKLEYLNLYDNSLTSVNGLNKLTNLLKIDISENQIESLDISGIETVTTLYAGQNKLTTLDVSKNTALETLGASNNQLTSIDVSTNTALKTLGASSNQLTSIDLSKNTALTELMVSNNQLTELDVSKNTALTYLYANNNQLTELDLSKNTALETLNVALNQLTELDVSKNTALETLGASNNQLTELDVSKNLTYLYAYNNQLTELDLSKNTALETLGASSNQLTELDLSKNTALETLDVSYNQLTSIDLSKNTALTNLYAYNTQLTSIDLSKNTALKGLYIKKSKLTTLDLSKNTALTTLEVRSTQLTTLDLSKNTALTYLDVSYNQLTKLDVSKNIALKYLQVDNTQLTSIDLSKNTALTSLSAYNAQLTTLDLSKNTALTDLSINSNPFVENKAIYKGETFNYENLAVKLPYDKKATITSIKQNNSIVDKVDTSNKGNYQYDLSFKHGIGDKDYSYTVKLNLYVIEATSDKYDINAEEGYIYTKTDTDEETILSNINLNYGEASIEDNKLLIKYNGELIKSFDIVNISSEKYDLSKKYVYTGTSNLDLNDINVINGQKSIEDNKLLIKYNDNLLESFDIVSISSEKYDLSKKYVYTGTSNLDLNDINIINGQKSIEDNKLLIKYNDNLLESFDIVSISSEKYDLSKKYVYTGTSNLDLNDINIINGQKSIEDNKLLIKYNDNLLESLDIVSISSEKYDLSKTNIYTGTSALDLNDINVINGQKHYYFEHQLMITYGDDELLKMFYTFFIKNSKYNINEDAGYIYTETDTNEETILSNINLNYGGASIEDNKLLIKTNNELLKSYDIVSLSSEKYDLAKDYIFTEEELNLDLINTTNLTKEVVDNKLIIRYNDEIFKSIDIVKVESSKYDLSKDYIYTGTSNLDLNDINVINGQKIVENNKLKIKYNNDLLKEYAIYNINFGEYKAYDGLLVLSENTTYEELTSNITTNGVTYKVFNGQSEITEGNINGGMIIKIYYGNEVVDEYEVTNEYLEFGESLNIDNEVNIIEKLPRNLKLKDFISLIRTSGSIEVRNNNELLSDESVIGTGSKLKITLSSRNIEYTLSVRGDVTGNGQAKMADVMKIATHIIEGNVISGNAFERAADITGDGKIKMNDVMKLATFIIDGGEL